MNRRKLVWRSTAMVLLCCVVGCKPPSDNLVVQTVTGSEVVSNNEIWLSHEHILVDFIGADSISPDRWDRQVVVKEMTPYLEQLNTYNVSYFVDATPNYLARDVALLEQIARQTGLKIITNTGLYGARQNKFVPAYAFRKTADELAEMWISEFEEGIDGTSVKPGFIKISVDATDPLDDMHVKLVEAAALTHLRTGLTIASHTGKSVGLWPQLEILKQNGVSPKAFIWVHAQNEKDDQEYLRAAKSGCWISLDGLGWNIDQYIGKLLFAKAHGILGNVLISHDAGWYDPAKEQQSIKPYTNIFEQLYPALMSRGFQEEEFKLLLGHNPAQAFSLDVRRLGD
ncbi:MAG: phosphotriesterase [Cyclobacteriaceae bacterium]